jgi:hypothetical protein
VKNPPTQRESTLTQLIAAKRPPALMRRLHRTPSHPIELSCCLSGRLGRAARRGCVRLRVGGPPGVEHDRELGMEATLRNRHRFLIIGHVGVEPGLKVDRSKFRSSRASRSARLGSVRASEARVIKHMGLAVPLRPQGPGRRQSDLRRGEPPPRRRGGPEFWVSTGVLAQVPLPLYPDRCCHWIRLPAPSL